MPTSCPDALAAAPPQLVGSPERLLVWVGNNRQAEALVHHAARLVAAGALPWTVICVDTFAGRGGAVQSHALSALHLAERLGANTASVNADNVVSAVVERVRQEHASMVLIGGHAPDGWIDGVQRSWLGTLADALSVRLPGVTVNVMHFPDQHGESQAPAVPRVTETTPRHGWLRAVGIVALCTLISETLLPYLELASVATVYLAGVVYAALRLGESAALLAVVTSILAFDLLVVEPRWSFKPTDPQYYFTFLVMLIVGMLVSRLADLARRQALVADARTRRAQALNDLASHLVSARSEADVGSGLAAAVSSTFGSPSALLLPNVHRRLADPSGFCRAAPAGADRTVTPTELEAAQRAFDADGRDEPAVPAPALDPILCLPLRSGSGALGVFVVRPPRQRLLTPEDRRLLEAFANQAALALERSLFERRSSEATVDAETERLRNTLLSGISHDFRTPLTTIVGSATSLLEQNDALDATRRTRLLRNILDEARRMHGSMSDVLDLTRMEEGAVQPNNEWCPADELVEEARSALGTRLHDRRVRVELPPDAVLWCDPRLVGQALVNLLDNAVRHTPAHCSILIRVEPGDGVWRLIVADDGPGLPIGHESDVFKKFHRARGEAAGAGTGLGLAICAAVARLHQGSIEASNAGGARFTLTLPQPANATPSLEKP